MGRMNSYTENIKTRKNRYQALIYESLCGSWSKVFSLLENKVKNNEHLFSSKKSKMCFLTRQNLFLSPYFKDKYCVRFQRRIIRQEYIV